MKSWVLMMGMAVAVAMAGMPDIAEAAKNNLNAEQKAQVRQQKKKYEKETKPEYKKNKAEVKALRTQAKVDVKKAREDLNGVHKTERALGKVRYAAKERLLAEKNKLNALRDRRTLAKDRGGEGSAEYQKLDRQVRAAEQAYKRSAKAYEDGPRARHEQAKANVSNKLRFYDSVKQRPDNLRQRLVSMKQANRDAAKAAGEFHPQPQYGVVPALRADAGEPPQYGVGPAPRVQYDAVDSPL